MTVLLALAVSTGCSGEPDTTSASVARTVDAPDDAASPPSSTAADPGARPSTAPGPTEPGGVPDPDPDTTIAATPAGFERVEATVTTSDGTVCELCLWLADDGDRRNQGLMFVTDLGAADGMAFLYPTPHRGTFWMKNTPLPLSIAFFAVDGSYLDAFDMEPCIDDPCELYPTPDDFLIAVEAPQGELAGLGIGPGSVLELSDLPCP